MNVEREWSDIDIDEQEYLDLLLQYQGYVEIPNQTLFEANEETLNEVLDKRLPS